MTGTSFTARGALKLPSTACRRLLMAGSCTAAAAVAARGRFPHCASRGWRGGPGAGSCAAGISTSFQELSLLSNLTVGENLLISDLPTKFGVVTSRKVAREAKAILAEWGVDDIESDAPMGSLPLSAKQRVEIVRAMCARPKVLILDEPTAALPETEWLFGRVRLLAQEGTTVLYISHKLAEIKQLCHRGTIMRNGAIVGSFDDPGFDPNELISTMIGRSIDLAFPARTTPLRAEAPIVLQARDLTVGGRVRHIDLDVHEGEIVGVAALEGQGQRELFYGLAGAIKLTAGSASIGGVAANLRAPRTAMKSGSGMALVPEDRKREGLFADLSTMQNVTSTALRRVSSFGLIGRSAERNLARQAGATAKLPVDFLDRVVGQLSGGNQQKAILARTSLTGAQVLLMFDPTRGIDPSAKLEVYGTLRKASEDGAAVLLYSTEIPELVGLCDRVIAIYGGRIAVEFRGADIREEDIMAAAVGHAARTAGAGEVA